jgi:signal transduction histidine kinase/ligand-binding sensor domain-containing protein
MYASAKDTYLPCLANAALALAAALCTAPAMAASPLSVIDLHHTAWTAKDGAPSTIFAIAQTPDRWLWLASFTGLYRFDGVRFERFQPPGEALQGSDIWGMRALSNGALWIGYRHGGASVWEHGKMRNYGLADGMEQSSVIDFALDGRGRVWSATALGLRVLDGARWRPADDAAAARSGACTFQHDAAQTIWAQCENGIYALAPKAATFVRREGPAGIGRMALAKDGTVWSTGGPTGAFMALHGPGKDRPAPPWPLARIGGGTMLFERDSEYVWVTRADGVMRAGQAGAAKVFGTDQGLSGSQPNCLFQDAEGNVWVGTENGLDRFRPTALQGVAFPQIYTDSPAVTAGERGALWVGNTLLPAPDRDAFMALEPETDANAVSAIYREGPDNVWTGDRSGIWHHHNGLHEQIALPLDIPYKQFFSMVRDQDDDLWVSLRKVGVLRLRAGAWEPGGGYPELAQRANMLYRGRQGRLWFSYANNVVRVLDHGTVRKYGSADGLQIGTALQIAENDDGVWLGGLNGLFHFDGQRFAPVLAENDDPLLGISGIIVTPDALWLNGAAGVTIVSRTELQKAIHDPTHRVRFRRLDHKDGLRGAATNSFPLPSAVLGSDGRMWFTTSAGLFWYDPARQNTNTLAPPVLIRGVLVDGSTLPLTADNTLPVIAPRPGRVQIAYTALSLTMPERMQFLYKLEGVDQRWQPGGPERMATYTDLAPGSYRFHVKASNNDGVWSAGEAVLAFDVAPTFYQTLWFRSLCGALLVLAIWRIHKLRLAHEYRRLAERMEARHEERERVARDFHDTILQSFQSLLLQVHLAWHRLPADATGRKDIERSLDLAQAALEEGRDKVRGLRAGARPGTDLAADLHAAFAAESPGSPIAVRTEGDARPLAPCVHEECRLITLEAVRNALHHAQARRIVVELGYGADSFNLTIRDDGLGIPDEIMQAGHLSGHWGMAGMRERASATGGEFACASAPGNGTSITVAIPADRAYGETAPASRLRA